MMKKQHARKSLHAECGGPNTMNPNCTAMREAMADLKRRGSERANSADAAKAVGSLSGNERGSRLDNSKEVGSLKRKKGTSSPDDRKSGGRIWGITTCVKKNDRVDGDMFLYGSDGDRKSDRFGKQTMRKLAAFGLAAVALLFSARPTHAQMASNASASANSGQSKNGSPSWPATGNPHSLLWKISGNGLAKPSYLFGTMHVICAEEASLSDSLKSVIASCDKIYFEINLSDMSSMLTAMMGGMNMNDDKRLSDLLSAKDYAKVKDYFNKSNSMLPFGMLERFKPMLVSSLLEEQGMGCKTMDGLEMMIMKESKNGPKKPIDGLETLQFQIGLFDSIPYKDQAQDLVNYIDSVDQYKKMTRELAAVYKAQDLDKIDELSKKDDQGVSGHMDLLLYGRNRNWAEKLDSLLREKSLLVAVGAAHLPGDQGVISLLRKKGYTLTPVQN